MVVAMIALLVALGGTAFAAKIVLPLNSVGTPQLKKDSVTSVKVKNRSLLAIDFKANQLPAGPAGPSGPAGPPGTSGTGPPGPGGSAARWALVGVDGNVVAQAAGLNVVVTHTNGDYWVNFGSPVTGHAVLATSAVRDADKGSRGPTVVTICGGPPEGSSCLQSNNTSTVYVATEDATNGPPESHAFYVVVL
jgi:hypothetical protein